MTKILWFLSAILTVWASVNHGILGGVGVFAPCAAFVLAVSGIIAKREKVLLLKQYAAHTENIYVFSLWEDDETVKQRANKERALLVESGNKLSCAVHEIYFGDVGHTNETWEEFNLRVADFIKTDRAKRHEWINKQSREFFETHILKQI